MKPFMFVLLLYDYIVYSIIEDIDECTSDMDNCNFDAMCTNTPGNFSCACNLGYSGDGVICVGM